jgi:hypothetical protein
LRIGRSADFQPDELSILLKREVLEREAWYAGLKMNAALEHLRDPTQWHLPAGGEAVHSKVVADGGDHDCGSTADKCAALGLDLSSSPRQ